MGVFDTLANRIHLRFHLRLKQHGDRIFLTGGRLRNFFLRIQPIFSEILEINRPDELELTGLIGYSHESSFGSQRSRAHYKGGLIQNSLIVVESVCQQFPSPSDPKLSRTDFQRVRSNIAKMNPYSVRRI